MRLGLLSAFTTPVFLVLVGMLTASTAACAWGRTRISLTRWVSRGTVTDAMVRQLRERPHFSVTGDDATVERAAVALRSLGMRVRSGPQMAEGVAGRAGVLGSPIFHWALVVLFISVSLGQLTRSEGQMGIPVGGSRPELAGSYGTIATGKLFGKHSGLTIAVPRIEKRNVIDGIDREPAPEVVLSDNGRVLRRQLVYPNNPLRFGAFTIHRGPFGFSLPTSVETSSGRSLGDLVLFVDTFDGIGLGAKPQTVDLIGKNGSFEVTLTLVPMKDRLGTTLLTTAPSMQVKVESSVLESATMALAPGTVALPDGLVLKLGSVGNYARVGVVRDASVLWIYAMLVLATIGLTLTMAVPYRVVWVMRADDSQGPRLNVIVVQARRDPIFAARVEQVLCKEMST